MAILSAAGLMGLVLGWAVVPLVYPRETAKARAAVSVYLGRLPLDTPEFQQFQRYFAFAGQILLAYGIFRVITLLLTELWRAGPISAIQAVYSSVKARAVKLFLILPPVAKKVDSELAEVRAELVAKWSPAAYPDGVQITQVRSLPAQGRSREWLQAEINGMKALEKGDVASGRVSGTVYHGGEELNQVIKDAMSAFLLSNPLHADVFPGVRKMESEIVSMCLNLFNGPDGAGTTTSGGTESILMSVKTHRDWARDVKGITHPEMVVPSSAHAAFWKGAEYFGIKLRAVPVNPKTRQADVKRMKRAINANTIMLVGSAPNFPDGTVVSMVFHKKSTLDAQDPIPEIGRLASKYGIGLHVDCCLGSFIMPFLRPAGLSDGVPKFDFSVPGVTAISCDVHKYAFCPKGSSVIMYRSATLRRYQYYVMTEWSGGVYASPSMAGSRPGAVLAGAWAVLNYVGSDGYTKSCTEIVTAARAFAQVIRERFPSLYVLGDPRISVVAFASRDPALSIYEVGDAMSKKGWHLNGLAHPAALHMAFTRLTAGSVDQLVSDLEETIKEVKAAPSKGGDMVALYGLGQTSVGPHVVGRLAETFLDVLYE